MRNPHHLTDEDLLRMLDRELTSRRLAAAAEHLAGCADCRSRQALIDGAAARFSPFYQQEGAAHAGAIAGREALRAKLLQAAESRTAKQSWWPAGFLAPRWATFALAVTAVALVVRIGMPQPGAGQVSTRSAENGALPVASLTPGATWNVSLGELCAGGARTHEQRPIPSAVRQTVLQAYQMAGAPADSYELDYLITPELGGAPDAHNLWPQRYVAGVWNARVKDDLERLLPRLVCNHRVDLAAAQRDIAVDWIAAYKKYFNTDAPLQRWARLSIDKADEADDATYPVWRAASAPALELISFPVRR
jgi:hypothetical protein